MSNMWNNTEEAPSEYEMLEESEETEEIVSNMNTAPHDVYDFSDIDESVIEEIQEEAAFDLEEEDVSSVYNVRVRLEQARLYEMLINHNLFDGVEASDQAINNVQKELKDYIITRLELLMGIRQPKAEVREEIIVEQPFNDVEVDFLKALSYKGTNGASSNGEYTQPEVKRVESEIKPVSRSKGLNPIQAKMKPIKKQVIQQEPLKSKPKARPAKKTTKPKAAAKSQPVKARAKTNNRSVTNVEMIKGKVKMTENQAMEIAKEEIKREKAAKKGRGGKDWGKMKASEKAAEIRRANQRNAKPASTNAAPMPDQNSINMHYQTQDANRGGGNSQFNVKLANMIANNK